MRGETGWTDRHGAVPKRGASVLDVAIYLQPGDEYEWIEALPERERAAVREQLLRGTTPRDVAIDWLVEHNPYGNHHLEFGDRHPRMVVLFQAGGGGRRLSLRGQSLQCRAGQASQHGEAHSGVRNQCLVGGDCTCGGCSRSPHSARHRHCSSYGQSAWAERLVSNATRIESWRSGYRDTLGSASCVAFDSPSPSLL